MKKISLGALAALVVFLGGCSILAPEAPVHYAIAEDGETTFLAPGIYVLDDPDDPLAWLTSVTLDDDGRFIFTPSAHSSSFGFGTYSVEEDRLILTFGPGFHFVFSIEGDTLVLVMEQSSGIPRHWPVEDGVRFILSEVA